MNFRAGVLGHPVGKSLSPAIFGFLSKQLKVPLDYFALDVTAESLKEKFAEVSGEYVGLNITIPYKEKVLEFVGEIQPEVERIGAANVIKFENGIAKAFNTDVAGVAETLKAYSVKVKGSDALIVGGGGAARAGAYALGSLGAKSVFVLNRNFEKSDVVAKEMGGHFSTHFKALKDLRDIDVNLIINATSVGMEGVKSEDPERFFGGIFTSLRAPPKTAFDMIYVPEETPFLKIAMNLKCHSLGGLDMLVYQALETWRIWFKPIPNSDKIRVDLMTYLKEKMRKNA